MSSERQLGMAEEGVNHRFNNLRWRNWKIRRAGGRIVHTATLVGGKLYIYGGQDLEKNVFQPSFLVVEKAKKRCREYVLKDVEEPVPVGRNGHTANLVNDKLFVFGGWSGFEMLRKVWTFDFVLRAWTFVETRGRTPLLNMHVSEYIEWMKCILCFGGGDGRGYEDGVNCLGVHDLVWRELEIKGRAPARRANACSCLVDTTLYIFGGWFRRQPFDDIHLLDLPKNGTRPSWSSPALESRPPRRVGASLTYFQGNILLFAGGTQVERYNDTHIFNVRTQSWRPIKVIKRDVCSLCLMLLGCRPREGDRHRETDILQPYCRMVCYSCMVETLLGALGIVTRLSWYS